MMHSTRPPLWPLLAAILLAGAACAPPIERELSAPPAPPASAPAAVIAPLVTPVPLVPPVSPLAARQQRALSLQHRGELAAALVQWRILRVLAPEDAEIARQVAATRALIRHRTETLLSRGDTAEQSGDTASARTAYLRVLALDPANRTALARLRFLETERVYAVQQARLDTLRARRSAALARKAAGPGGGTQGVAGEGNGNGQERDYRDTGVALFEAGDFEASVLEFKKYLGAFPEDEVAQGVLRQAEQRLAEVHRASEPLPPNPSPAPVSAALPPAAAVEPGALATPGAGPAEAVSAEAAQAAQELYEQGLRVHRRDIAAAIHLWEQSLERDPGHVQARLRLEQAQKMQRRLETIDRQ